MTNDTVNDTVYDKTDTFPKTPTKTRLEMTVLSVPVNPCLLINPCFYHKIRVFSFGKPLCFLMGPESRCFSCFLCKLLVSMAKPVGQSLGHPSLLTKPGFIKNHEKHRNSRFGHGRISIKIQSAANGSTRCQNCQNWETLGPNTLKSGHFAENH